MSNDKIDHFDVVEGNAKSLAKKDHGKDLLRKYACQYLDMRHVDFLSGRRGKVVADSRPDVRQLFQIDKDNVITLLHDEAIKDELYHFINISSPSTQRDVLDCIKREARLSTVDFNAVQSVALKDDPRVTWSRLPFTKDEAKTITLDSIPEFKHFLSLFGKHQQLVVLWIGSLLDPESSRAQYLHIQSPGGDGKSALLEAFRTVFPPDKIVTSSSETFASPHFGTEIEGARLLVFPDENNTSFFSSGQFKRYTGESSVTINPKNKQPRNILLTHKTLTFSNNPIQITNTNADKRRLLSVVMEPDTETGLMRSWYSGLKNSGSKILSYCFAQYLIAHESDPSIRAGIPVDEELQQAAVARTYEDIISVLTEQYEVTGINTDKVKTTHVHKYLQESLSYHRNSLFFTRLREALSTLGIDARVKIDGHHYYKGIKVRSHSGSDFKSKAPIA